MNKMYVYYSDFKYISIFTQLSQRPFVQSKRQSLLDSRDKKLLVFYLFSLYFT